MSETRDLTPQLVEAPALRDQVYERLRESILAGELQPGERLSAAALAAQFGISAMPVRDALRLLEQDGIVETAARRWTRVAEIEPSEVEEIIPLLSVLEQYALTSARTLDPQVIDEMERANGDFAAAIAKSDLGACVSADLAFHEALVRLAGNRALERMLRDPRARVRLLRTVVLRPSIAGGSHADHTAIVEALRAGDRTLAAGHLEANWTRGIERYRAGAKAEA